jgi:hypothetical protein
MLEPEAPPRDTEKTKRRGRRQSPPVQLEVRRQVLEPDDKTCAHCHRDRPSIGQETTTEYNYEPAPSWSFRRSCGPNMGRAPADAASWV